jgi:hypothetical protein
MMMLSLIIVSIMMIGTAYGIPQADIRVINEGSIQGVYDPSLNHRSVLSLYLLNLSLHLIL